MVINSGNYGEPNEIDTTTLDNEEFEQLNMVKTCQNCYRFSIEGQIRSKH